MKKIFEVSVIIPVYNAAEYIRRAVVSVVQFDCVSQLLLVEDGSTDNSLTVCEELEKEFPVISVLQHEDGENRGAAASRNLGIRQSTAAYVAFLDADDYFLPNRFDVEREVFPSELYDCICGYTGCEFASEAARQEYVGVHNKGINYVGPQEEFWLHQSPTGYAGTFTTNAITIEKRLLERIGLFDESLLVSQDTELWLRLGLFGRFLAIGPSPIAIRYVYVGNRSRGGGKIRRYRPLVYIRLIENSRKLGLTERQVAVYAMFFIIHFLKNLFQIRSYSSKVRINLLQNAFLLSPVVMTNLFWLKKFFMIIRPSTKDG